MRVKLSDVTKYLKGTQINGDDLIENGEYIYLNGGINPSGRWNAANVKGNTVTISEGGNSSGYVNYVTEPFWCGAHCYYLFDGPKNTRYLYYALKSQQERLFGIRSGACMPNIKKADLGKFEFEFDMDEQKQSKVVSVLSKIEVVIGERKRELELLDELIKARFIEMFGDPMTNPHNLPRVTLGSVLTIEPQNGLYKPQSDYVSDKTGVPILRIDGFYDGKVLNFSSLKRLICSEIELKRYSLYENDIVINRVNSIEYLGKCGLVQGLIENTVFESNMMRLHVDEHKLNPVYITKLLCSQFIYQQILRRAKKAVNQASINQKDVQSLVVYMPPIEQQERFAAFAAQTDKSKVAVQKALDETQLLFDSLMQKYFG